jgi:hypothetical protein
VGAADTNGQQAQAMGKTVILVAQGDQYDQQRQEFALGSYLLVSDGLAYFRYTNTTATMNKSGPLQIRP